MRCFQSKVSCTVLPLLLMLAFSVRADPPTAAINASPIEGAAPLGVFFDASSSSADAVDFFWDFGDGAGSTAKTITHIYTVAGSYLAVLTVTNAAGATAMSQITIVVTGSGQGPVSGDINYRWATYSSLFKLNFTAPNHDSMRLNAAFNTVDLPTTLNGLAASFGINAITSNGNSNNTSIFTGVMGESGIFTSPVNVKPVFSIQIDTVNQLLIVDITKANLASAFAQSGAVPGASGLIPVAFSLTIGAQTYVVNEQYSFTSNSTVGQGIYDTSKRLGAVQDGFFVINKASALQSLTGTAHFFEFDGYISRSMGVLLQTPGIGNWVFTFNDANKIVVPFDRIQLKGTRLVYSQPERDLHGLRKVTIDTVTRLMTIKTWDIPAEEEAGGTGLPLRDEVFIGFNFAVRLDLDQLDGTTLHMVTATRLTRKSRTDAFWQTGRRKPVQ